MTEMSSDDGGGNAGKESERDATNDRQSDPLIGTVIGQRYRVDELIGRGGMGSVYRATHIHMKRPVALKVLHREMTVLPDVVKRFEREAVAAGRIDHQNVAGATDFGQLADGSFYLALEYVEGTSLAKVLVSEKFSSERAARVARQIALALDAAHSAGIVHRDLKPDNVMLIDRGEEPELVKVLDFGIAKVQTREVGESEQPITRIGAVFGTPEYMSPEQAAGQSVDHRADLYCLGLVFYRMLAGRPPFTGEEVSGVLAMQITQPPPPLPQSIDPQLVSIVMRLLKKNPPDRYQSAKDLALDLGRYLGSASMTTEAMEGSENPPATVPEIESTGAHWLDRLPGGSIGVAGRRIPAALAALSGVFALALVVFLIAGVGGSRARDGSAKSAAADSAPPPLDPEVESLLARAFTGDRQAIAKLEARPEKQRSAREWLALARGRTKLHQLEKALPAYREALKKDPELAHDRSVVQAVYAATTVEEMATDALHLAANRLGATGADILYDAWVRTTKRTPTTKLAEELVKSKGVRTTASPALQLALGLRDAETCEEFQALLPKATLHGDQRALRLLAPLRQREDCDFNPSTLEAAIAAVNERPAPTFH